ncbi:MAG: NUDIX domain-containing protein [Candidatus Wildermuthbacteria bacterium]|nr:NUDIX domain-containing protein [Candidatus Wildermuthbacteria bacterium]
MRSQSVIDKVAWLHIQNRKLLVVRSYGNDMFFMPGGKREQGESDALALLREAKEELNVDLIAATMKLVRVFEGEAHGKPPGTLLRSACYAAEHKGELKPSSEIEEIAWFTSKDTARATSNGLMIMRWLAEQNLID